MFVIQIVTDLT